MEASNTHKYFLEEISSNTTKHQGFCAQIPIVYFKSNFITVFIFNVLVWVCVRIGPNSPLSTDHSFAVFGLHVLQDNSFGSNWRLFCPIVNVVCRSFIYYYYYWKCIVNCICAIRITFCWNEIETKNIIFLHSFKNEIQPRSTSSQIKDFI